jgi:Phasin protein
MAQIARTARALTRLAAAGADLTDTALKLGESAVAAGAVIGHRVALGAQAMNDPLGADHGEFARMGLEKLAAFTASSQALAGECHSIQHEVMKFTASQTASAFRAAMEMATAFSPGAVLAAQRRWAADSLARANAHAAKLVELSAGMTGMALAPVHETVTRNAARLSAPRRRR